MQVVRTIVWYLASFMTIAAGFVALSSWPPTAKYFPSQIQQSGDRIVTQAKSIFRDPPPDINGLLTKARETARAKNYAASIALCNQAINSNGISSSQRSQAHDYISHSLLKLGRLSDALANAELAIKEDPTNYYARINRIKVECAGEASKAKIADDIQHLRNWMKDSGYTTSLTDHELFKLCKDSRSRPF